MRCFALFSLLTLAAFAQSEPQSAEEFYNRAQQSLGQKQLDRVIDDCTQALLRDPDFHEALLLRATAWSQLNQHDKAIADLDAVLKLHPRASTFVFQGNQLMLLKNYEAARAAFTEAIRRLPNGPAAYQLRSNARAMLGDSAGAADDAAKSQQLASASSASKWFAKDPAAQSPSPDEKANQSGALIHRIGGSVTPPKIVFQREPVYTEEARQAKVQGAVVMSVVIDSQGQARDFKIVRPLGYGLDERAIEAVQHWHFQPGTKDGQPVSVYSTIEVTFRLL